MHLVSAVVSKIGPSAIRALVVVADVTRHTIVLFNFSIVDNSQSIIYCQHEE